MLLILISYFYYLKFSDILHTVNVNISVFLGKTNGEGDGTPLQYSCLENPMDRGAWWAAVHGVAKSRRWLSDFTFTFHFHALEKEMATHSGVLAWRIPGTGEPGGLPSMGSHRVRHNWSDLAAAAAVKAMVFPVVMYGCEIWTIKKAEGWRIDAFELWCWRRLLRVPWLQGDPTSPF